MTQSTATVIKDLIRSVTPVHELKLSCAVLYFVFTILLSGIANAQESTAPAPELKCAVQLEVVTYPALAWQARLSGTATVFVTIDAQGGFSIEVEGVHQVIKDILKRQFSESKFDVACNGQKLKYVFDFRLEGAPSTNLIQAIRFRPPNSFTVIARPPTPFKIVD